VAGIWPQVKELEVGMGKGLCVNPSSFRVLQMGTMSLWVQRAIERYSRDDLFFPLPVGEGLEGCPQTTLVKKLHIWVDPANAALEGLPANLPSTRDEEHYYLAVDTPHANLTCGHPVGCLRGLETFAQLLTYDADHGLYDVSAGPEQGGSPIIISDAPTYGWRGVMIDTGRHYLSPRALLRVVNTMSLNKLNVFHWHISDTYAFPLALESRSALGEEGTWEADSSTLYSKPFVQYLVSYAADRGIRVVPELDSPSRVYSWGKGEPEAVTRCPGVSPEDVMINASGTVGMAVVEDVLQESKTLFGGDFLHVGADVRNLDCWESTSSPGDAQKQLELYLLSVFQMVRESERTPIVWDNVLRFASLPEVPRIVQTVQTAVANSSWSIRTTSLILSNGWEGRKDEEGEVLDWKTVYRGNRELGARASQDDPLVAGGEIVHWGYDLDGTNLEPRLWPASSAAAERLWNADTLPAADATLEDVEARLRRMRCTLVQRGVFAAPLAPEYCALPPVTNGEDMERWKFLVEPATTTITLIAFACIYVGAHRSLMFIPSSVRVPGSVDMTEEVSVVSLKQAILFPVVASAFLLFCFAFIDYIIVIFTVFISIASVSSVAMAVLPCLETVVTCIAAVAPGSLPTHVRFPYAGRVSVALLASLLVGLMAVVVWLVESTWWAADFLGICLAVMGVTFLHLPNLKVAYILLWIFFCYDLFWVFLSSYIFGESVMESVAVGLADPHEVTRPLPIALEIPYVFRDGFQLLGLGDIVLPGTLVALLLRLDYYLAEKPSSRRRETSEGDEEMTTDELLEEEIRPPGAPPPKIYFTPGRHRLLHARTVHVPRVPDHIPNRTAGVNLSRAVHYHPHRYCCSLPQGLHRDVAWSTEVIL